jgi:V8-like Glu-specific endopeptidase
MTQQIDEQPETNDSNYSYTPTNDDFQTIVEGVDDSGLENIDTYRFHDLDWDKDIDFDALNIQGDVSSLSYTSPETVCGRDDRVKMSNTTSAPYKFICKLLIKAADGLNYIGTGFFIGPRCIITSGHCVHSSAGWAREIRVIPGMNGGNAPFGSETSSHLYSVTGWVKNKNSDYDHGAIILPNNNLYNRVRGYFGYRQENGLPLLNNSGYPGDKNPTTEQWYNAGRATRKTEFKFEYMIDTAGGQSGSPTWLKSGNSTYVVGVHGYGGCPNKCVRSQGYVLQRWAEWRQK